MIGGSLDGRPSTGRAPTPSAMARTAARSSGDAAGKPASMTSTPSRASARATSSFSADVIVAPGHCSPSRSVVSKIRTYPSVMLALVSAAVLQGCSVTLGASARLFDRIEERHHRAQLLADVLDDVIALLRALRA